jgi:hypothetical protein
MKEKSFFIFVWCHQWNARVSLEGADTTSYELEPLGKFNALILRTVLARVFCCLSKKTLMPVPVKCVRNKV